MNGQTTKYSYDEMRRLLGVTYPTGGGTESVQYDDTPGSLSVTYSRTVNSGATILGTSYPAANLTKVALADGLGRLSSAQLTSDPYGAIEVDTTYDSLGRVASTSNPYRSKSEATYGLTHFTYDALSRKSITTEPDGSITQNCFNGVVTVGQTNCYANALKAVGTWEDAADENGNDWQRTKNVLDELTHVAEPSATSAAPTLETDYSNDVLGNLLTVQQRGLSGTDVARTQRTFTYDSLSRLVNAFNPERGMASYTYDANGNVLTEISPLVNASTGTQTIGYCYDNMNRLVGKWSAAPAVGCNATPSTVTAMLLDTYTYGAPGSGDLADRLTGESAYMNGQLVANRSFTSYDSMGSLQQESQIPFSPSPSTYTFNYSYDLSGNLISANNGLTSASTSLGFAFSYDAANRLQLAATTTQPSTWSITLPGSTSTAYYPQVLLQADAQTQVAFGETAASDPYDAMGHMINAQIGLSGPTSTTAAIELTRSYDKRGRILSEDDNGLNAAESGYSPIYSYQVPSTGGYAPNSNLLAHNDSVTGKWTFQYDNLNRLTAANSSSGNYSGESGCWTYDDFGNRKVEAFSTATTTPCATGANDNAQLTSRSFNASNRDTGETYDAAGNILYDGQNNYLYDIDGRLCAVSSTIAGVTTMTQYVYDASGTRVAKGSITAWPPSCAALATSFAPTNEYLLGPGGQAVTELTLTALQPPSGAHSNVFVGGHLLATYDFTGTTPGLHFPLTDPLGTKRVQVATTGAAELNCLSLPFGNNLGNTRTTDCLNVGSSTAPDDTEHHFTGKERDAESGNDYFEARYYSSAMGRFMSPDWSAHVEPVPYAKLDNPQSLNLYVYMLNNPLDGDDEDGHDPRQSAVRKAWRQERNLVRQTGRGTRAWTAPERNDLLQRGRVAGYEGHHINNVANNPGMAGDPNNIEFLTRQEHLDAHGGNFANATSGELVSRAFEAASFLPVITMFTGAAGSVANTGMWSNPMDNMNIVGDAGKTASFMESQGTAGGWGDGQYTFSTASGFWGTLSDPHTYSLHDGAFWNGDQKVDPKTLNGKAVAKCSTCS